MTKRNYTYSPPCKLCEDYAPEEYVRTVCNDCLSNLICTFCGTPVSVKKHSLLPKQHDRYGAYFIYYAECECCIRLSDVGMGVSMMDIRLVQLVTDITTGLLWWDDVQQQSNKIPNISSGKILDIYNKNN